MIKITGSNVLLKFRSTAPLNKLKNLSLSLREGPRLLGLNSLKLASRCLRTLIGTSSEQEQLDKEL